MGNRYSILCGGDTLSPPLAPTDAAAEPQWGPALADAKRPPGPHVSGNAPASPTGFMGFDILSHHLTLLTEMKASGKPMTHSTPGKSEPAAPPADASPAAAPAVAVVAAAAAAAVSAARAGFLNPFELPPPRFMSQQLHHYGLRPDDINLTRALRRCTAEAAAAAGRSGGGGGAAHCPSCHIVSQCAGACGGVWRGDAVPAIVAGSAGGSGAAVPSEPATVAITSTPTLGPPLLTEDEAAPAAAGELLLPPAASPATASTATATASGAATSSAGDGRSQLLLLGSVQLMDAGEGHGVGAAGGALRVLWEIPLSAGTFSDSSANEPCGCNVRVASPAFRVPVQDSLATTATTATTITAANDPRGAHQAPNGVEALWAAGSSGASYWRLCWALFDHDASRVSLYLLHTPGGRRRSPGLPPAAAAAAAAAAAGGIGNRAIPSERNPRPPLFGSSWPSDRRPAGSRPSDSRPAEAGLSLPPAAPAAAATTTAAAATTAAGGGLPGGGGAAAAVGSEEVGLANSRSGKSLFPCGLKQQSGGGEGEGKGEGEGEGEPEELWLTWRMEVAGLDGAGSEVKKIVVPGELSHLFHSGQRGWGVQGLLSASELDELLGCSRLRVAATLVHPPMAAEEVLGSEGVAPAYMRNRSAALDVGGGDSSGGGGGGGGSQEEAAQQPTATGLGRSALSSISSGGSVVSERRACRISDERQQQQQQQLQQGQLVSYTPPRPVMARIRPVSDCEVLLASLSPRIVVVDDFLPPGLCDALRALSEPRLIRSRVSTGAETPSRVSRSTFFTGDSARLPEVVAVEARIQQLMERPEVTGGAKPTLVKSEALQVVGYDVGGFYSEHYDNKAGGVISRAATIIVYLEDTAKGGATFFPKSTGLPSLDNLCRIMPSMSAIPQLTLQLHQMHVPRPGLRIFPAKGRAAIFWSRLVDGTEDITSLHSAEAVRAGSKWICTRWFKELSPI